MNKNRLRNFILMGASGLVLMNTVRAGSPLWTFAQVPGYPSSVRMSTTDTATIKYTVINQSHKSHMLKMRPIQGIVSSGCTSPLGYHQSCTLTLAVNGSGLKGDVLGGPVLYDQGNSNQGYQPSQVNSLAIHLTQAPPIQRYTVTSSAGTNGSISPNGTQTVNSGTTLTFTATPGAGYGVNQWLIDGALAQTGGITYQMANITANRTVSVTFDTVTLTPSVVTLGLSVNCQPSSSCTTTQNSALTGNLRQITIQNTGSVNATNVSVSAPDLPSGTSISSNTCTGTLVAGGSCIITLTPGSIASPDSSSAACTSGTQPVASTVTVAADGGLFTVIDTYVLSYGCIVQEGYVYTLDDTTPNTSSIGGKAVSLTDQAPRWPSGVIWSSNSSGTYDGGAVIYGIAETSTTASPIPSAGQITGQSACNGRVDGRCNSNNIIVYYSPPQTNPAMAPSFYAAGRCSAYSVGIYDDWYLPAICEMGPAAGGSGCNAGTQNILSNLPSLIGNPNNNPDTSCVFGANCIAGNYFSSTEFSGAPQGNAWLQYFTSGVSSTQDYRGYKYFQLGVRCSRVLTL